MMLFGKQRAENERNGFVMKVIQIEKRNKQIVVINNLHIKC